MGLARLKKKVILNIIICLFLISLMNLSLAKSEDIIITVTFNKNIAYVGEEIQATYSISGGTGDYTFVDYTWQQYIAGQWTTVGFNYPTETTGTVSFIPTKGTKVSFYMHAEDSNGVKGWASVEPLELIDGSDGKPITISVKFNKDSVSIGEEIQATYSIIGGTGDYTFVDYTWQQYIAGQWTTVGFNYPTETTGTVSFTPTKGTKVSFYMHSEDSDGVKGWASVEPLSLFCASNTHNISIIPLVSPTDVETGLSEGQYCAICGKTIIEQRIIPALNNMTTLRLPSSLQSIETEAFTNLACHAIIIPDGCTSIGEKAFADCHNLIYVKIPSSIKNYPESTFESCNDNLVIDWANN